MREKEKQARREYAEEMRSKSVAEKSTFASRMAATVPPDAESRSHAIQRGPHGAPGGERLPRDAEQTLAAAASPGGRRRPDRERIADFIEKKREIFLVQMSLDVKRAEIRKLEERTLQRCVHTLSLGTLVVYTTDGCVSIPYRVSAYRGYRRGDTIILRITNATLRTLDMHHC
jgi:hypothetical protein